MSIKYQLVSMGAILRDWRKPQYISGEHEMLVDIADFLYNANLSADYLKPEYKVLYDKYSQDFWDKVLKDMGAIDSQLDHYNIGDLVEEYQEMLEEERSIK